MQQNLPPATAWLLQPQPEAAALAPRRLPQSPSRTTCTVWQTATTMAAASTTARQRILRQTMKPRRLPHQPALVSTPRLTPVVGMVSCKLLTEQCSGLRPGSQRLGSEIAVVPGKPGCWRST